MNLYRSEKIIFTKKEEEEGGNKDVREDRIATGTGRIRNITLPRVLEGGGGRGM